MFLEMPDTDALYAKAESALAEIRDT